MPTLQIIETFTSYSKATKLHQELLASGRVHATLMDKTVWVVMDYPDEGYE